MLSYSGHVLTNVCLFVSKRYSALIAEAFQGVFHYVGQKGYSRASRLKESSFVDTFSMNGYSSLSCLNFSFAFSLGSGEFGRCDSLSLLQFRDFRRFSMVCREQNCVKAKRDQCALLKSCF